MQISDQYSQHITPLGFALETDCDSANEKFLLLFAKKDYKAAEAVSPFVAPRLWFECLFYINDLYRARDFIFGCKKRPELDEELLQLCCADSQNPALVFGAQEFVQGLDDGRTGPIFTHKDGVLEPVRQAPTRRGPLLPGSGLVCVRSPSRAHVHVHPHSVEHRLCRAASRGQFLSLSTLELFSGVVSQPLLAEALFVRRELKAFDAMLARFPACADYILELTPIAGDGHKGQVEDMQAHVLVLQARQAALQALGEVS
ncbi:MAG: hypothetical protein H7228_15200 [Polaromonas sp.]|nr:hypothetical protein [Polaromonas sp.]